MRPKHYRLMLSLSIALMLILVLYILFQPKVVITPPVLHCPTCNTTCEECEPCEPSVVEIVNYVCSNGSVMSSPEACVQPAPEVNPVLTNEEGTFIENVEVKPACVQGYKGGMIFYEVELPAQNMIVQVKEAGGEYEDKFFQRGLFNSYIYFTICEETCPRTGEFALEQGKVYLVRLEFPRQLYYNRTEYSNEYVVNLLPGSDYMTKKC